MENEEYMRQFLSELEGTVKKLPMREIDEVIEVLFRAWKNGNRIFVMGNGGSASTATHFACDLTKTVVEGKKRFKVIGLTDNIPLITALTNDTGFGSIFVEQLKNLLEKGDVVVAISVHGGVGEDRAGPWSQNLLAAVRYAKQNSAVTVGITGFDGGALKDLADACVVVPINSTPHVESFHLVLEHLICGCLKDKIERYEGP